MAAGFSFGQMEEQMQLRLLLASAMAMVSTDAPQRPTPPTAITAPTLREFGSRASSFRDAQQHRNEDMLTTIHAKLLCSVDDQGVSKCVNFKAMKELGKNVDIWSHEIERAYEDGGLDRGASTLLRCGGRWATSNADVASSLSAFPGALPETERAGAIAAIRNVVSQGRGAPLFVPGAAHVSEFALACGGALGGSGGGAGAGSGLFGAAPDGRSSESEEERSAADALKERMNEMISSACSGQDSRLGGIAAGAGEVVSGTKESVDLVTGLYELWHKKEGENTTGATVAAGYEFPKSHAEGDAIVSDKRIVTVELTHANGETARYVTGDWTVRDADGYVTGGGSVEVCTTSAGEPCSNEEMTAVRASAAQEKEVAEAKKKENDERRAAEAPESAARPAPTPPPSGTPAGGGVESRPCNSIMNPGCVDSCAQMQMWWSTFLARCEDSNWQEYQCQKMLRPNCPDPALIYPGPDGSVSCMDSGVQMDSSAKAACEDRLGIMNCGEEDCRCDMDLERGRRPDPRETAVCDPRMCDPVVQF